MGLEGMVSNTRESRSRQDFRLRTGCLPIKVLDFPFWHQNANHWHAATRPGWDAPVINLLGKALRNRRRFSQHIRLVRRCAFAWLKRVPINNTPEAH